MTLILDDAFGEGEPGEKVAEEIERQIAAKPRGLWKPKRVEVEEFFDGIIEVVKRAQGHDGGVDR